MKLLHLDSSALGSTSVSRELSAAIVAAYRRRHAALDVRYRDLAAQPLPHWTPSIDSGEPASVRGGTILEEFLAADVVVIGAPMYNFGVPSQLKAWIDRIAVAGKTFRYTAQGPQGLAGGRKIVVASSRGGFYGPDSPAAAMDFQESYLRSVFGFLGVTDIEVVRAEGVNTSSEQKALAIQAAHAAIDAALPLAA